MSKPIKWFMCLFEGGCAGECSQGRRPCDCAPASVLEEPECKHDWNLVSDPLTTTSDTAWFKCSKCGKEEGFW